MLNGGPVMAAMHSPGGPYFCHGWSGGLNVLPRTVWGDQLMYDRPATPFELHKHRAELVPGTTDHGTAA